MVVDFKAGCCPPRLPETQRRWKELLLPGVRSDGEAEMSVVGTLFQSVGSGDLAIRPTDGQFVGGLDGAVSDCMLFDSRTDYLETLLAKKADKVIEPGFGCDPTFHVLRSVHN